MKHELIALFRALLYVGAIVLVMAILTRIGIIVDSSVFVEISSVLLVFGVFILLACAFITSIARFWSSFFTGEGYMTFSLPATPAQILIAKMLSALVAMFFGVIVAIVAVLIATLGTSVDILRIIAEFSWEYIQMIASYLSSDPLVAVEAVVLVISAIPMTLLFFYLIMSIGQLFTKGRKGLTFVMFIGAYWVVSILEILLYDPFLEFLLESGGLHAWLWVQIGVNFALDFGMFFIVRYILLHKVNLII